MISDLYSIQSFISTRIPLFQPPYTNRTIDFCRWLKNPYTNQVEL